MTIATQLLAYLSGSTIVNSAVGGRIYHNEIPQTNPTVAPLTPLLYMAQGGESVEGGIDASEDRLYTSSFDIECVATSISAASVVATKVKNRLRSHQPYTAFGTSASGKALGVDVDDHDDNYVPRSVDTRSGFHVIALAVSVIHNT